VKHGYTSLGIVPQYDIIKAVIFPACSFLMYYKDQLMKNDVKIMRYISGESYKVSVSLLLNTNYPARFNKRLVTSLKVIGEIFKKCLTHIYTCGLPFAQRFIHDVVVPIIESREVLIGTKGVLEQVAHTDTTGPFHMMSVLMHEDLPTVGKTNDKTHTYIYIDI
jgi:hypothetical protein